MVLLTYKPSGEKGFGYDPIFFIPKDHNITFAEMPAEKK